MHLKIVLLLACLGLAKGVEQVRYDNYRLYKVRIDDEQHYELLNANEKTLKFNNWQEARHPGESSDIMLPPESQKAFENLLKSNNFNYSIKINNVQRLIDGQRPKLRTGHMEWTQYHTLAEIYAWLDELEARYPHIITPFTIGKSYEGRIIRGIKISHKPGNGAVFIESNIHAREWITSASITYFIDELLVPRNPAVRDIAQNVDWYIIPVLNVDGFSYSHEVERLWRKSRLPSDPTGECIGTDLNRNFDYRWMVIGASDDPCSQTYAGPFAESDPEISQLTSYINNHIPDGTIKIYISLHSYGQYLLSPWGHTAEEFPAHYPQMMGVAKGFADALIRRYGTVFTYGSSATTLYPVSGSGKEWAYGVMNITIPYTIELRDKGDFGFLLPPEDIIPVGREVTEGFVGMIAAARGIGVFDSLDLK
ncbi:zinc carboxypeptidase [Drosophila grimshawi]|nr:zinc carboxypeptidase [Drosophila grimshawi]